MSEQAAGEAPLILADVQRWREWLTDHDDTSDGVWLLLAKKNVVTPTSITYQQALEEALCSGWIDGQRRRYDEHTFLQRFTPRRARSVWSQRNVDTVARLGADGRLRPRGSAEIERARSDGRWDRAYAGPSTATPPVALDAALDAAPGARAAFERLTRAERYSALHPLLTAPDDHLLARRVQRLVDRLTALDDQSGTS